MKEVIKTTIYARNGVWHINANIFNNENGANERLRFSTAFKVDEMGKQSEAYYFLREHSKELTMLYLKGRKDNFKKMFEKYKSKNLKLFKNVVKDFIKEIEVGLKPRSRNCIIERLRPALSFFEFHNIKDINRHEIERFFDFLDTKEIKLNTKKHYAKALKRVLNYAYETQIITNNPFKMRRWRELKSNIQVFNENEILTLLKESKGNIGTYLKIALLCGARTGEILALQWKHIDFNAKKIHISQSLSTYGLDTCKTENSQRIIDLLPPLYEYLKKIKEEGGAKDEDFIFKGAQKDYIKSFHKSYLKTQYVALLERLNIDYKPIYNTRHSFASFMLSKGENLMWVSWMLGHKNTQITLNFYAKYIPSGTHAQFLERFVGGAL